MIEFHEILSAYQAARRDLLARREASGHWVGQLSSSALSTATAASALAIVARHEIDPARGEAFRNLAARSVDWLVHGQNEDGGWGNTDRSCSNISTTMLVRAAIHLTGKAEGCADALRRAAQYIEAEGGIPGLRKRYGRDKTFAVPILANCALAGLVPWKEVPSLPFELACLPHAMFRFLRLPVVSYAVPALVAVGQSRFFHRGPRNPIAWLVRRLSVRRSVKVLEAMQPPSGGYLEAVPLTSFIVMSLASTGRTSHGVTRRGVAFLLDTVRPDASWPIDTNLAVWNTTLAVNALGAASGNVGALGCLDWLLESQHGEPHPFTHATPGGWGWSDSSGAVPDVDDTAGALLALRVLFDSAGPAKGPRIEAIEAGLRWLLAIQNVDGGWPTFCRGWGALPFDRSGADLTAHALRGLHAWQHWFTTLGIEAAVRRGLQYLAAHQDPDGAWQPLWFGNQYRTDETNPVYGTARVLAAYRDLGLADSPPAQRGLRWLVQHVDPGGGWGAGAGGSSTAVVGRSSIEETALAIEILVTAQRERPIDPILQEGLEWLVKAVQEGRHRESAPIGLYFAKLWYYERVYPLAFTVAALGRAIKHLSPTMNETGEPTELSP